jgi:hypothetical protein
MMVGWELIYRLHSSVLNKMEQENKGEKKGDGK